LGLDTDPRNRDAPLMTGTPTGGGPAKENGTTRPSPARSDIAQAPLQSKEWRAWRRLCEVLAIDHKIKINDADRLCAAITAWAEELATLRSGHPLAFRARILNEKREEADRLLGDVPID